VVEMELQVLQVQREQVVHQVLAALVVLRALVALPV
jgi:hypothetical protein